MIQFGKNTLNALTLISVFSLSARLLVVSVKLQHERLSDMPPGCKAPIIFFSFFFFIFLSFMQSAVHVYRQYAEKSSPLKIKKNERKQNMRVLMQVHVLTHHVGRVLGAAIPKLALIWAGVFADTPG